MMQVQIPSFIYKLAQAVLVLSLAFTASIAAAASFTNEVEFEIDDAEKLPLSIVYTFTNSMEDHTHTDRKCNRTFRIKNDDLHSKLVNSVLLSVFEQATEAVLDESSSITGDGIDLITVISPVSTTKPWWEVGYPCATKLSAYEIWFGYKITLLDHEGTQIAQWALTSFGSVDEDDVRSRSIGVREASALAFMNMRTNLIDSFRNEQAVIDMVNSRHQESEVEPMLQTVESEPAEQTTGTISNSQPTSNGANLVDDLSRLQELFEQGVLTEEEFSAAKGRLLGL